MDLEDKDRKEKECDQELAVTAKLQLEEWYAKYNEKIAATKAENRRRQAEQMNEDQRESDWEKVVNLCGFRSARSTRDTNRMRSILLKMKESQTVTQSK